MLHHSQKEIDRILKIPPRQRELHVSLGALLRKVFACWSRMRLKRSFSKD